MMTAVVPAVAIWSDRAPTSTPSAPDASSAERDAAERLATRLATRLASVRADLEVIERRNVALLARAHARASAARAATLPIKWVAQAVVATAIDDAIRSTVHRPEAGCLVNSVVDDDVPGEA